MGKREKRLEQDIALQRIIYLLKLAESVIHYDYNLAQRYAQLAVRIARRARVKIPMPYKMFICKKCNSFLYPGINCRVRIRCNRFPHITITCLVCGNVMRRPFKL